MNDVPFVGDGATSKVVVADVVLSADWHLRRLRQMWLQQVGVRS